MNFQNPSQQQQPSQQQMPFMQYPTQQPQQTPQMPFMQQTSQQMPFPQQMPHTTEQSQFNMQQLPPGASVVTTTQQVFESSSMKRQVGAMGFQQQQQQHYQSSSMQQSNMQQQQHFPQQGLAAYQQPVQFQQQPPIYQPAPQQQQQQQPVQLPVYSQQQPVQQQQQPPVYYQQQQQQQSPQTYEVIEPQTDVVLYSQQVPQAPQSVTLKNILASSDGQMMVQEAFLIAGQGKPNGASGPINLLDLQGIWTRGRVPTTGGEDPLMLSLRMRNQGTQPVMEMRLQFRPNCFGLTVDPSATVLPAPLGGGQSMQNINLNLYCSADNQKAPQSTTSSSSSLLDVSSSDDDGSSILGLQLVIEYRLGNHNAPLLQFPVETLIPLHLFFQTHQGAPSDDGPRVAQSVFISLWQNEYAKSPSVHQISVKTSESVPTVRWYQQFIPTGIARHINSQSLCPTQDPSLREIIAILEHKLSINRIYTVAARELSDQSGKVLVLFVSMRVGGVGGAGSLVLGEMRFGGDGFSHCTVCLKSKIDQRFHRPIERAIQSILLS